MSSNIINLQSLRHSDFLNINLDKNKKSIYKINNKINEKIYFITLQNKKYTKLKFEKLSRNIFFLKYIK